MVWTGTLAVEETAGVGDLDTGGRRRRHEMESLPQSRTRAPVQGSLRRAGLSGEQGRMSSGCSEIHSQLLPPFPGGLWPTVGTDDPHPWPRPDLPPAAGWGCGPHGRGC